MIFDYIDSSTSAIILARNPIVKRALEWLRAVPDDAPEGIVELDGGPVCANICRYSTKSKVDCLWESHRETVDIHYCRDGGEIIEWTTADFLEAAGEYRKEKDTQNWTLAGKATGSLHLKKGCFAICLANEPHLPCIQDGIHPAIRKIGVKIPARLLL